MEKDEGGDSVIESSHDDSITRGATALVSSVSNVVVLVVAFWDENSWNCATISAALALNPQTKAAAVYGYVCHRASISERRLAESVSAICNFVKGVVVVGPTVREIVGT